jgi:hypothetical protein
VFGTRAQDCNQQKMQPSSNRGVEEIAKTNEARPQTVEHVGIYADLSVGLRLGLVSLYVVSPRLRRGVALTEKS